VADYAAAFSRWLDSTYPADLDRETWMRRRVTKVCEEAGEVHEAVGAYWGENPRKPRGPIEDVLKELADCAGAALGAIEHLTGHEGRSLDIVTERVREVCERVGVTVQPHSYWVLPEDCQRSDCPDCRPLADAPGCSCAMCEKGSQP
jgi:NTP pyrophosphatase (non-canonical NTP hydrolase)